MLPLMTGITGYYTEENDGLTLELHCLRNLQVKTFRVEDETVINTIKQDFSPILEDYLGDSLPGFNDTFFEMQSHSVPDAGEEREFEIFSDVKMKFCWIPAGKAILGSPENEEGSYRDEYEREFQTNGFWMGKYPVTQAQWMGVMEGHNPSHFKGIIFAYLKTENLPVERVNRYDCQKFIEKCGVSGLKLRLPHEDQWEYACRGGKGNKQAFYWGNTLNGDKANCRGTMPYGMDKKGTYLARTSEVGSYEKIAPHPWGLCDMIGNVWEWCENANVRETSRRVLRGGGWDSKPENCRSAKRNLVKFLYALGTDVGFRLIIC